MITLTLILKWKNLPWKTQVVLLVSQQGHSSLLGMEPHWRTYAIQESYGKKACWIHLVQKTSALRNHYQKIHCQATSRVTSSSQVSHSVVHKEYTGEWLPVTWIQNIPWPHPIINACPCWEINPTAGMCNAHKGLKHQQECGDSRKSRTSTWNECRVVWWICTFVSWQPRYTGVPWCYNIFLFHQTH